MSAQGPPSGAEWLSGAVAEEFFAARTLWKAGVNTCPSASGRDSSRRSAVLLGVSHNINQACILLMEVSTGENATSYLCF